MKTRKGLSYFFALLYMLPSSISASQFERWHLDHHAELGTEDEDPEAPLSHAENRDPALQGAVHDAGTIRHLLHRLAESGQAVSEVAAQAAHRARESVVAIGLHIVAIVALWQDRRVRTRRARTPRSLLHHVPHRVHHQPGGTALRHRSRGPGEVVHPRARETRSRTSCSSTRTTTSSTTTSRGCRCTTCPSFIDSSSPSSSTSTTARRPTPRSSGAGSC